MILDTESDIYTCYRCNKVIVELDDSYGTGYGIGEDENKYCYACCAEIDKEHMRSHDKMTLYLTRRYDHTQKTNVWVVENWPGSLEIFPLFIKEGNHNMTGIRYDVWFDLEGDRWWGVSYGQCTDILHCSKLKKNLNHDLDSHLDLCYSRGSRR